MPAVGSEYLPEAELVRSEYYNDYLRPQGLFYMTGVAIQPDSSIIMSLSALRGHSRGAFSKNELAVIQALVPHLQNAMNIRRRIEDAELSGSFASQSLAARGTGVALLERSRRIRHMSVDFEQIATELGSSVQTVKGWVKK